MHDWLADAVLYEIYPQSFADSDGDGIGDLRGVIDHLDHLSWLGVDTIWFNPCFASPFVDAGYDVADYLRIAPRYGTNDDMVELVEKARERGIRVLLDLVVGHTSVEHPWFQAELAAEGPHPDGDRYVWCLEPPYRDTSGDLPGTASWVPSPGPRPGWYLKNFYDAQPALNFGWAQRPADEPWRDAVDAPGPLRNRQALKDILDFWLRRGSRASASTWRSRSSRTIRARRRRSRCGASSARGSTPTTPTPCSSPRAASRAPAARSPSTPTSSW